MVLVFGPDGFDNPTFTLTLSFRGNGRRRLVFDKLAGKLRGYLTLCHHARLSLSSVAWTRDGVARLDMGKIVIGVRRSPFLDPSLEIFKTLGIERNGRDGLSHGHLLAFALAMVP